MNVIVILNKRTRLLCSAIVIEAEGIVILMNVSVIKEKAVVILMSVIIIEEKGIDIKDSRGGFQTRPVLLLGRLRTCPYRI